MNYLKYKEKRTNFLNQLKYAEQKIFSICIDVYKIYEGDDFNEMYKTSTLKKNKNKYYLNRDI